MKKKEKQWIAVLVAITLILIVILVVRNTKKAGKVEDTEGENKVVEEFVQVLEDGTKLNTSNKLKETKKLDNLQIGNIQLTNQDGQSVLLADVTNAGEEKTDLILLDIVLLDKTGAEIATIPGIISPLNAGETTQLNTSVQQDYANAYDFKLIKK